MSNLNQLPRHNHYDRGAAFPLGKVIVTENVRRDLTAKEVLEALLMHMQGIWGGVTVDDHYLYAPDEFEEQGGCLAAYRGRKKQVFWIASDFDRKETKVFMAYEELPDDHINFIGE
jgi:hypothetical protein